MAVVRTLKRVTFLLTHIRNRPKERAFSSSAQMDLRTPSETLTRYLFWSWPFFGDFRATVATDFWTGFRTLLWGHVQRWIFITAPKRLRLECLVLQLLSGRLVGRSHRLFVVRSFRLQFESELPLKASPKYYCFGIEIRVRA